MSRGVTLTATSMSKPACAQRARWRSDCSRMKSVNDRARPVRWATATISGGGTQPNCGWAQRNSASNPLIELFASSGLRLEPQLELTLLQSLRQVGSQDETTADRVAVLSSVGLHAGRRPPWRRTSPRRRGRARRHWSRRSRRARRTPMLAAVISSTSFIMTGCVIALRSRCASAVADDDGDSRQEYGELVAAEPTHHAVGLVLQAHARDPEQRVAGACAPACR